MCYLLENSDVTLTSHTKHLKSMTVHNSTAFVLNLFNILNVYYIIYNTCTPLSAL